MVLATQLLAKGNVEVTVSDGSLTATNSVAVSTNDRTWGTAGPIETDDKDNSFPGIAMAANGDAIAVWLHGGDCDSNGCKRLDIWANRYVASTGWETAGPIESDDKTANEPQIAMDANGNAIAVWEEGGQAVWANRYTAGAGWGTAGPIVTTGHLYPKIAMNASGDAIVVSVQSDSTGSNIWANRYTAGAGWGTAGPIMTAPTGAINSLQIAMDANGNAIAVWSQCNDAQCNTYSILANQYTAGTGWGTATPIVTDDKDNDYPAIAMDANGNAIVVWPQYNDA